MFSKIRDLAALGTSNMLGSIVTAGFWFYLASVAGKEQYGEAAYLISIANIAFAFANFGLSQTVVVYGAKKENVFSQSFSLGLILTTFVSVLVLVFTANYFVVMLIFGMMIFNLHVEHLSSQKRYVTRSKYRIARSILIVGLSVPLFHFLGSDGIVLGFALAAFVSIKSLYQYIKNEKISIYSLKPKLNFMFNGWLNTLSNRLFWWGDKIIVATLMGFSTVGVYHLAIQYIMLLFTLPSAMMIYLLPQEAEGLKNRKIKRYACYFSILLVLITFVIIPPSIAQFFPDYIEATFPIQLMSVGIVPLMVSSIFESKLVGNERPRPVVIGSLIQTGVYFALIVALGSYLGIFGLALSFLISTFVRCGIFYAFSKTIQN